MSFLGDNVKVEGMDKEALSKLKGVRVLTLESKTEGKLMKSLLDDLTKALRSDPKAETLVETRDKGNVTSIFFTSEGMLIVTKETNEITIVFILGEITKKWMQEIVAMFKK